MKMFIFVFMLSCGLASFEATSSFTCDSFNLGRTIELKGLDTFGCVKTGPGKFQWVKF